MKAKFALRDINQLALKCEQKLQYLNIRYQKTNNAMITGGTDKTRMRRRVNKKVYVLIVGLLCGSAVAAGAELLHEESHEDAWTEAASLPPQVYPQRDCLMPAGWSLLPHPLLYLCLSGKSGKV